MAGLGSRHAPCLLCPSPCRLHSAVPLLARSSVSTTRLLHPPPFEYISWAKPLLIRRQEAGRVAAGGAPAPALHSPIKSPSWAALWLSLCGDHTRLPREADGAGPASPLRMTLMGGQLLGSIWVEERKLWTGFPDSGKLRGEPCFPGQNPRSPENDSLSIPLSPKRWSAQPKAERSWVEAPCLCSYCMQRLTLKPNPKTQLSPKTKQSPLPGPSLAGKERERDSCCRPSPLKWILQDWHSRQILSPNLKAL